MAKRLTQKEKLQQKEHDRLIHNLEDAMERYVEQVVEHPPLPELPRGRRARDKRGRFTREPVRDSE